MKDKRTGSPEGPLTIPVQQEEGIVAVSTLEQLHCTLEQQLEPRLC